MIDNKIINGFWSGRSLRIIERLSIQSFLYNGHHYRLWTNGAVDGVPDGVETIDARDILKRYPHIISRRNNVEIADLFRYIILRENGGWWCDLDIISIKPFDFSDDVVFGQEELGIFNTAVLKFPPNHLLMDECLNYALYVLGTDSDSIPWGEIGPAFFTRIVTKYGFQKSGYPIDTFYPYLYKEVMMPFIVPRPSYQNSYAIHLWNTCLPHNIEAVINECPTGCLFNELMIKYGVSV